MSARLATIGRSRRTLGLPAVEVRSLDASEGDAVVLDLAAARVTIGERTCPIAPVDPGILTQVEQGGLLAALAKRMAPSFVPMTPDLAFTGLADEYDRWRPRYPDDVLTDVVAAVEAADPAAAACLVDVGAGTGISTRFVRDAVGSARPVLGIEPDADMRRRADEATPAAARVTYREGDAEHIPLADGSAALVLAAQSLQWFDRPAFLAEVERVLRPRGVVAVLQNDRDWSAGGVASAFEDFLERHSPGYSRFYRSFPIAEELEARAGFGPVQASDRRWHYELAREAFVAMALTSSKTQRAVAQIGRAAVVDALAGIAASAAAETGAVTIPYVTRVFWARRDDA